MLINPEHSKFSQGIPTGCSVYHASVQRLTPTPRPSCNFYKPRQMLEYLSSFTHVTHGFFSKGPKNYFSKMSFKTMTKAQVGQSCLLFLNVLNSVVG